MIDLITREIIITHLNEECSEVIKEGCKTFRFGLGGSYQGLTTRQRLVSEIADVKAMVMILEEYGILTDEEIKALIPEALAKKRKAILEEIGFKIVNTNP